MAINFKDYKPNIAERSTTTYKIESPDKVTVDNSHSVGYNGSKETNSTITQSTDHAKQWLDKNQGLLKYAGDNAKKSIHAGLDEAPSYMRDADEGTNFEDVQTASVKRHLAKDANDNKLHNSALMEMIGHLSKDNKEPYLKHTLPLQTFIDAKDKFDFKQNNYTTTKNIDTTPDENVRQLQRELNEAGYTDKVGQRLIEDGVYDGKTAYADDSKKAHSVTSNNNYNSTEDIPNATDIEYVNNTNQNKRKFSIEDLPYDDLLKLLEYLELDVDDLDVVNIDITEDGMVRVPQKTASLSGPMEPVYEYIDDILNKVNNAKEQIETKAKTFFDKYVPYYSSKNDDIKLSDSGRLSNDDEKYNNVKKTMLKCLSANWYGTSYNKNFQEYIHKQADKLRQYDDNSFKKAVLLNNSDGASGAGHNAIMLINKDNKGLVFSFYSSNPNFTKAILNEAEVRFGVLSSKEVDDLLNANNKNTLFLVASDNTVVQEKYDRVLVYDLQSTGYNMYNAAVALYDCPGYYSLAVRHCDDIAIELMNEAGIDLHKILLPNGTYFVYDTIDMLKEFLIKENIR